MKRRLSLRMRLTLVTMAILTAIAVLLTVLSMRNANSIFVPMAQGMVAVGVAASSLSDDFSLEPNLDEPTAPFLEDGQSGETDPAGLAVPLMEAENAASLIVNETPPEDDGQETIRAEWSEYFSFNEEISISGLFNTTTLLPDAEGYVELLTMEATPVERLQIAQVTVSAAKQVYDLRSIFFLLLLVLAGGLLVYFALGFALKPVRAFSRDVSAISANNLHNRLEVAATGDEVQQLADSFNHMLERLETAFSAQKQFAAAAAHELKTPLAAIAANLDVLQMDEQPTTEDYQQTLQVVRKQTGRMTQLVEDLFAMSALTNYPCEERIPLAQLFAGILSDLAAPIAAKRLAVTLDVGETVVLGNAVMLQRAFANLVENAVKYNPPDGAIDISYQEAAGQVVCRIRDAGSGVPEEALPQLFEPFYRVDASRNRQTGGAGLGLAIARAIFSRHQGQVEAENLPDRAGMCFTVTLPLSLPPAEL